VAQASVTQENSRPMKERTFNIAHGPKNRTSYLQIDWLIHFFAYL
jgi:hypothetical protein